MTKCIDSHQHFWNLQRGDYAWLTPDLEKIYKNFLPADLADYIASSGIDKTVVVQATDTLEETEFLLKLAQETPWVAGVVGWVDMEAEDATEVISRLASNSWFKGIRPMIQGIPDDDWILDNSLDMAFKALVNNNLCFDALVLPRHLTQLYSRLQRTKGLKCVINHGAKPDIASGDITNWKSDISRLANETDVMCKLSGLVTEAGPNWQPETLRPVIKHLFTEFTAKRLMFGSDWPVLNLASDYESWMEIADEFIQEFAGVSGAEDVWANNAKYFYSL